ncbi:MAG: glycosyltransferase [Armatimonadota bacterium]
MGENIVCFAKDWSEDPTSNNHVMRLLARRHRVLWLNSISMRSPSLSSGQDVRKIRAKIAAFLRGPKEVEKNLWVFTPLVLPFPHHRLAIALNRVILRATLAALRRKLSMREFQLWSFLPNAVEYAGRLGESLLVYYCIDEWSKFGYLDGERMARMDEEICRKADVVFATAHSLKASREPFNAETLLALHGVDHEHFSRALLPETPPAPELAGLRGPVIGFFGLIQEWVDQELLAKLAARHPDWNVVIVGKSCVDTSALERIPNVRFLGRKPYSELPAYCKGFDVALIPFLVNDLTVHVNPIKLREYLSAGLSVVSTALPEVAPYGEHCRLAGDHEEFIRAVEEALRTDSPERRRARSEAMRAERWEQKVADLETHVSRVKAAKCSSKRSYALA